MNERIERVEGRPLGPERASYIINCVRKGEDVNWRNDDDNIKKIKLAIQAAVLCSTEEEEFKKDLKLISEQFSFH